MSWTEDRVDLLKKLWAQGHSASQIAKQLGGVTRNAVIGKVHRLGLSGRATPSRPKRMPSLKPRLATSKAARTAAGGDTGKLKAGKPANSKGEVAHPAAAQTSPPVAARSAKVIEELTGIEKGTATVLTLNASTCRWPIGEPENEDFRFCGRAPQAGSPYCAGHSQIAFQPSRRKKSAAAQNKQILGGTSRRSLSA